MGCLDLGHLLKVLVKVKNLELQFNTIEKRGVTPLFFRNSLP